MKCTLTSRYPSLLSVFISRILIMKNIHVQGQLHLIRAFNDMIAGRKTRAVPRSWPAVQASRRNITSWRHCSFSEFGAFSSKTLVLVNWLFLKIGSVHQHTRAPQSRDTKCPLHVVLISLRFLLHSTQVLIYFFGLFSMWSRGTRSCLCALIKQDSSTDLRPLFKVLIITRSHVFTFFFLPFHQQ